MFGSVSKLLVWDQVDVRSTSQGKVNMNRGSALMSVCKCTDADIRNVIELLDAQERNRNMFKAEQQLKLR